MLGKTSTHTRGFYSDALPIPGASKVMPYPARVIYSNAIPIPGASTVMPYSATTACSLPSKLTCSSSLDAALQHPM